MKEKFIHYYQRIRRHWQRLTRGEKVAATIMIPFTLVVLALFFLFYTFGFAVGAALKLLFGERVKEAIED